LFVAPQHNIAQWESSRSSPTTILANFRLVKFKGDERFMPQHPQSGSWAGGDITEEIIRREQQWASAAKANDPAKVATLLAEVFIEMDSDGTVRRKADTLDRIKSAKWQVFEISDIKVVLQGNMAIATGTWRGKGTSPDGKTIDAHEHWLDTWHKNGRWQCIASASANVTA
jgi:ketosteroid isomerase-like protein